MSLCLSCKHGYDCPYMMGVEDFIHIMVDTNDKMLRNLMGMVEEYNMHIEKKYRFRGPLAGRGLEVGLDISHCEGYAAQGQA